MNGTAIQHVRGQLRVGAHAARVIALMAVVTLAQHPVRAAPAAPQEPTASQPANAEHPAVVQWRRAHAEGLPLDVNHFPVQPPAAVTWLERPHTAPQAVVARR